MTVEEAINVLELHNKWRKGADIEMQPPTSIGMAIDLVVCELKNLREQQSTMFTDTKEKEEWIRNEVAEYDWEKCGFGDSSIEELLEKGYRKGYEDAICKIHSKMDSIKEKVIEEYEKGNIVIDSYGELISVKLTDFIEASADEILYELNRDEATVLTFINNPKWINDFAASRVIRALKEKIDDLENYLNKIQG
jgi:hypothetical protein